MALTELEVRDTKVADLSPLKGMPIQSLNLGGTAITDLEMLRGMPLTSLWIYNTKFTDLRPLEGMPIRYLNMFGSKVKDLSPLRGMPLTDLKLHGCNDITDLSPLADCKELGSLTLPPNVKNIDLVRAFPKLLRLDFSDASGRPPRPAAEFWQAYDTHDWLRALRESGFGPRDARQLPDGTWDVQLASSTISDLTILKGAPISILNLGQTSITDLAPLRGMAIKDLKIYKTKVTDLSPLQGMAIQQLNLGGMKVTDLSALRGMPLTLLKLHDCPSLTDLSPLADAKELIDLTLPPKPKDIEFLRAFPKLERLSFKEGPSANGYRPTQTAAEFWKEYDAKKK
jgi:Leucine-rich repeat (LRR) protein